MRRERYVSESSSGDSKPRIESRNGIPARKAPPRGLRRAPSRSRTRARRGWGVFSKKEGGSASASGLSAQEGRGVGRGLQVSWSPSQFSASQPSRHHAHDESVEARSPSQPALQVSSLQAPRSPAQREVLKCSGLSSVPPTLRDAPPLKSSRMPSPLLPAPAKLQSSSLLPPLQRIQPSSQPASQPAQPTYLLT